MDVRTRARSVYVVIARGPPAALCVVEILIYTITGATEVRRCVVRSCAQLKSTVLKQQLARVTVFNDARGVNSWCERCYCNGVLFCLTRGMRVKKLAFYHCAWVGVMCDASGTRLVASLREE